MQVRVRSLADLGFTFPSLPGTFVPGFHMSARRGWGSVRNLLAGVLTPKSLPANMSKASLRRTQQTADCEIINCRADQASE